ncbi:MAG: hypothetical protein WCO10_02300 [bacterium]
MKNIKREHIWLGFLVLGPITAFSSVYYPALIIIAVIFILIGLKGVFYDLL